MSTLHINASHIDFQSNRNFHLCKKDRTYE